MTNNAHQPDIPANQVKPMLSLVIPAYREGPHLPAVLATLESVLSPFAGRYEVLIVDDGSPDDTYARTAELAQTRPWLKGIRLSRNFGKEAAMQAGLEASSGQAVITMDADLQHPPEIIPRMVEAWKAGSHVVHATKADRQQQGQIYSLGANLVSGMISRMTGIRLKHSSDFKLLDRQVVDIIVNSLSERERLFRGLAQWVGFNQTCIDFDVAPGTRDDSRWSMFGLAKLAVTALVSFSSMPMHIVTMLGWLTLLLGFGLGAEAFVSWLRGSAVSGFLTLLLAILIIGSFIMISLGIIGIYIAKIYEEIKGRPLYIIQNRTDRI